jgi:GT2 family glycosyltransferase
VVIVHFGSVDDTLAAIDSVRREGGAASVVVDQGMSTDALRSGALARGWPNVDVIGAGGNRGFAAGANLGLRRALDRGAGYAFLLNNDATIAPGALSRLRQVAEADPRRGILAPTIFYADEPARIWSAGGRFARGLAMVREVSPGELNRDVVEVDVVTGCAMLLTRPTVERLGLFDEGFFMYCEDVDYCLRARLAGLKVVVVTGARAYHRVPTTPRRLDGARGEWWARSKARCYTRLAGDKAKLQVLGRLLLGALLPGAQSARSGDPRGGARFLRATVRGWLDGRPAPPILPSLA